MRDIGNMDTNLVVASIEDFEGDGIVEILCLVWVGLANDLLPLF